MNKLAKYTRDEWTFPDGKLLLGDCLAHMKAMKPKSVDLVCASPPYEDVRTYGIDYKLKGQDWVDWMVEVFVQSLRVCRGLVAFIVGHGKGARKWSAVPALLIADLHRKGINLRSPLYYQRHGIMGGGGNDWFKGCIEFIVCATDGKIELPWHDNVACGHAPVAGPGGDPSYRLKDGTRTNLQRLMKEEGLSQRAAARKLGHNFRHATSGTNDAGAITSRTYVPPEKANPGNVIDCGSVGGSKLGSNIAHDTDAPYPEKVPDFIIRSCCKKGGVVYDPFGGSGTTIACAIKTGRHWLASDLRESQIQLMLRRIKQARRRKGFGL